MIDIGPNPHAREMLIAYLPKQRIVFQGDMFFLPYNDAPVGPPQEATIAFARKVKEKGLAIDQIAGVHGRTGTGAEFQRAVSEKLVLN
jgi:hypothetical protein